MDDGTSRTEPFATRGQHLEAVERALAAARAYYTTDMVVMDDAEYDLLIRRIAATEAAHPDWRAAAGLVDRVAGGVAVGGAVSHTTAMLSLDNAMDRDELESWFARFVQLCSEAGAVGSVCVEPKLDGLAVSARYEQGRLVLVATRGDGSSGEDVTGRVRTITGLPRRVDTDMSFEVRGEVYMTDGDFDLANERRVEVGKRAFVNPRNGAAGALRAERSEVDHPLHFAAYDLVDADEHDDAMARLESWGFATARGVGRVDSRPCTDLASVWQVIADLDTRRGGLGFAIDGAVVKANTRSVRAALGVTAKAPRWAIAYKYPADARRTVVVDIVVQVGRTGVLTPVADLEPVFVGGTTITRATLSNPHEVARKDVRVGDTVWVRRAGEVIPEIVAVDLEQRPADSSPWVAPEACPRCDGPLDTTSKRWRCENRSCGLVEALCFFAGRKAMDIDGLGAQLVTRLVDAGLVTRPSDLYGLTTEQLETLERMGATSAAKLVERIDASRRRPVAAVVCGLGIGTVGSRLARVLTARYPSLEDLRRVHVDDVGALDGFGPVRARIVVDDLAGLDDELVRLAALGVGAVGSGASALATEAVGPWAGKRVVVTGTIPGCDRSGAEALVVRLGATVVSTVSSKCDLVVYGDKAGSKLAKATAAGIETMDGAHFVAFAREHLSEG